MIRIHPTSSRVLYAVGLWTLAVLSALAASKGYQLFWWINTCVVGVVTVQLGALLGLISSLSSASSAALFQGCTMGSQITEALSFCTGTWTFGLYLSIPMVLMGIIYRRFKTLGHVLGFSLLGMSLFWGIQNSRFTQSSAEGRDDNLQQVESILEGIVHEPINTLWLCAYFVFLFSAMLCTFWVSRAKWSAVLIPWQILVTQMVVAIWAYGWGGEQFTALWYCLLLGFGLVGGVLVKQWEAVALIPIMFGIVLFPEWTWSALASVAVLVSVVSCINRIKLTKERGV